MPIFLWSTVVSHSTTTLRRATAGWGSAMLAMRIYLLHPPVTVIVPVIPEVTW